MCFISVSSVQGFHTGATRYHRKDTQPGDQVRDHSRLVRQVGISGSLCQIRPGSRFAPALSSMLYRRHATAKS